MAAVGLAVAAVASTVDASTTVPGPPVPPAAAPGSTAPGAPPVTSPVTAAPEAAPPPFEPGPVAPLVTAMSEAMAGIGYACVQTIRDPAGDITTCITPDVSGRVVVESAAESVNRILIVTKTPLDQPFDPEPLLAASIDELVAPDEAAAVRASGVPAADGPIGEFIAGYFAGRGELTANESVRRYVLDLQRIGTAPRPPAGLPITKAQFDQAMAGLGLACTPDPTSSMCSDPAGTPIAAAGFYPDPAPTGAVPGQLYVSWFSQSNPDPNWIGAWWGLFAPILTGVADVTTGEFAQPFGLFMVHRVEQGMSAPTVMIAPIDTTTRYL